MTSILHYASITAWCRLSIERLEHFLEDVIGRCEVEELHGCLEFEDIDAACHDVVDVLVLVVKECLADYPKSLTEDWMLEICLRFFKAIKSIVLGVVAVTQSLLLGEYIPDPVASLSAVAHLLQCRFVIELLSLDETFKVIVSILGCASSNGDSLFGVDIDCCNLDFLEFHGLYQTVISYAQQLCGLQTLQ